MFRRRRLLGSESHQEGDTTSLPDTAAFAGQSHFFDLLYIVLQNETSSPIHTSLETLSLQGLRGQ